MKRGTAGRTTLRGVIRNSHAESLTAIFSGQITFILASDNLPPPSESKRHFPEVASSTEGRTSSRTWK
jgi:hypothetical protein